MGIQNKQTKKATLFIDFLCQSNYEMRYEIKREHKKKKQQAKCI